METNTKKKVKKQLFFILIIFALAVPTLNAQIIDLLEFRGSPIADVLQALAKVKGKSIVIDDSVGSELVDFTFRNMDVDRAFDLFLTQYNLYKEEKDSIYRISRFRVEFNPNTGMIAIDAEQVDIIYLLDAISKAINKTIQYDPLPEISPSVHNENINPKELLDLLITRAPGYKLNITPHQFYIENTIKDTPSEGGDVTDILPTTNYIRKNGPYYSINQRKKRFQELLAELFFKERKEYVLLAKRDLIIESLMYDKKNFEDLLTIILEHANADFSVHDGIYYIFAVSDRDILKQYKEYEYVQLNYITANEVQRIMPSELGNSKFFRINQNNNALILSGSRAEIEPIRDFIKAVDKPLGGVDYYRYDLHFLSANNIKSILPAKYRQMEIVTIPDSNSIVLLLSAEGKKYMDDLMAVLDKETPSRKVALKYLKAEDLMKNLPPSVSKDDIVLTGNDSVVFFKGADEKFQVFQKELSAFDKPIEQIRYQVLVLTHTEGESLGINNPDEGGSLFSISNTSAQGSFSGTISNLLGLNFNIPNVLGYATAFTLNAALSNNTSKVMIDTILSGVSGEKVSFQDTEVARYADLESTRDDDDDSGSTTTTIGATREVTTGFTLNIEGWVSGDEMVSMEVDIKISKQGTNADTSSGSLGSTYDKVVNTSIRTSSGEAIKIGGLIKQDVTETVNKIPFLGDIPYLGRLFQTTDEKVTKSEIVVYILPQIIKPQEDLADTGRRLEFLYNTYMK